MALPAVLSAVRQLILDGINLPITAQERQALYAARFVGLSPEEVEDLSQMDPARLDLYTRSIFSAEGRILQNYFPFTLYLLSQKEQDGTSPAEIARRIHRVAPWRGVHSPSLGECFGVFILQECRGALHMEPAIGDVYRFEQASLEIRKAPNAQVSPQSADILDSFALLTVHEMLELNMFVAPLVRILHLSYDVNAARQAFLVSQEKPVWVSHSRTLIGARSVNYGAAWREVTPSFARCLKQSAGNSVRIANLAEAFLADAPEVPEADAFRDFFAALRECIACGALSLHLLKD